MHKARPASPACKLCYGECGSGSARQFDRERRPLLLRNTFTYSLQQSLPVLVAENKKIYGTVEEHGFSRAFERL